MRLRISRYTKIYRNHSVCCLVNSLTQKKMYLSAYAATVLERFSSYCTVEQALGIYPPREQESAACLVQRLARSGFLVSHEKRYPVQLESIRNKLSEPPKIRIMYLLTTDACNYNCRYCFVFHDLPPRYRFKSMSVKTAQKSIDYFSELCRRNPDASLRKRTGFSMIFYGGEPLLNREIVEFSMKELRRKESQGFFGRGGLRLVMITNGSLVDESFAELVNRYRLNISVSIDGFKRNHDQMRIFRDSGLGTYDSTMRGFDTLRKKGCNPSISFTLNRHNIEDVESITRHFCREYRCSIGMNFPVLPLSGFKEFGLPPIELFADKVISAFRIIRKHGLYEDRMMRYVNAFVHERPRINDCAGCGEQIVVSPEGMIGPCPAFLSTKKYFTQDINSSPDVAHDPTWMQWKKRSPFTNSRCLKCECLAICGGGCAHLAYTDKGSIDKIDGGYALFQKRCRNGSYGTSTAIAAQKHSDAQG